MAEPVRRGEEGGGRGRDHGRDDRHGVDVGDAGERLPDGRGREGGGVTSKWEPCNISLSWKQAEVLESLLEQAMDEYFQDVAEGGSSDDVYIRAVADVLVKVENAQEEM